MSQHVSKNVGLKLGQTPSTYNAPRDFFVREMTRFLHIQDDAMTRGTVAWNGWMDRRHAGVSSAVEMLQQTSESTNQEELLLLHRKLLAGYCERWTRDVTYATEGYLAAYQRAIFAMHATMTGLFPSVTVSLSPSELNAKREPAEARSA
jgi:hypothetical protein